MECDQRKPSAEALERVAKRFTALADPLRLQILYELSERERCGKELVEILGARQSNISKQLKLMLESNLVSKRHDGNKVYYSLFDETPVKICRMICECIKKQIEKESGAFNL